MAHKSKDVRKAILRAISDLGGTDPVLGKHKGSQHQFYDFKTPDGHSARVTFPFSPSDFRVLRAAKSTVRKAMRQAQNKGSPKQDRG